MRYLAVVVATFTLTGCGKAPPPVTSSGSKAVSPEVVEFLLTSAATDFHVHRPPDPNRFRDVRIGHVMAPSGDELYMLCGEFLTSKDKAEWVPFVTIKTSGYEHLIGGQALAFCRDSAIAWDKVDNLSASLQRRLDALR